MTVTTIPTTVMSNKRQQSAGNRITTLLRLEGPQSMQMITARSRGRSKTQHECTELHIQAETLVKRAEGTFTAECSMAAERQSASSPVQIKCCSWVTYEYQQLGCNSAAQADILLKSIVVCGAAARLSIHKFEHGI